MALAEQDDQVETVTFRRNLGKAMALAASFRRARGDVIVTLDANLQDGAKEIPRFLKALEGGSDLVCGWRKTRQDPRLKVILSRIYNWATRTVTGVPLRGFNCGFKAYCRDLLNHLRFYGELHRYIPVLAAWRGYRVTELRVRHHPRPAFLDNPLAHVGLVPRVLTAVEVAGRYLWLMVWPQRLSPDYSYNQIPVVNSPWVPGVLLAALAWGALIGLACWSYQGTRRVFLCVGFTLITFLPVSNFLIPIGTIMGERLFYLPSAGLCLLAGVAWQRVMEWCQGSQALAQVRGVGLILLAVVISLLATRTVLRNRDWRDHATLFMRAVEVAPNSAKVRFNLAGAYLEKGL